MPTLNLKPTHKAITTYYAALARYQQHGITHETAVRAAFQALLETCARQMNWTLICEYTLRIPDRNPIRLDGALLDKHNLPRGTWEAKGVHGNLRAEIQTKFDAGYPQENILFQTPERAILYQNGREVLDADITDANTLVSVLKTFFAYEREHAAEWETAIAEFRDIVPELKREVEALIQTQHQTNTEFRNAFSDFHQLCQNTINPNLSRTAVEEMLIQHLLTERTFRTVFDNPDFTRRNIIAKEIEKVIDALASRAFSRNEFLRNLDRFYRAVEREAATLVDFSQKQHFLNTVYEQFFQGASADVADTHGIVYTPQPIVDFMVKSVDYLLQTEFGRSLSDTGVHIIDAFVGTGNFIVRLIREIDEFRLEEKYRSELWCNEVLLLPYYIASLNIEHEFYDITQQYVPFEGISLVDTFDLAENRQLSLLTQENTERVERQKASPMFVVIGNPPYNVGQKSENDNNKNRKYAAMDARIEETYVKASTSTLRKALYDPYVKSLRWASDRIGKEGIVALVTNNSFLDGASFDGMRKHLAEDFDRLYIVDLGGNARTDTLVSDASVFGVQVGVSINFFVKGAVSVDRSTARDRPSPYGEGDVFNRSAGACPPRSFNGEETPAPDDSHIFYFRTDDAWNKNQKFEFLSHTEHIGNVPWQTLQPDARHTWLTEGLNTEFLTFLPIGSKTTKRMKGEATGAIFHQYSPGASTGRDGWTYNFNRHALSENVQSMSDVYNEHVIRWRGLEDKQDVNVDNFVDNDKKKIKWSRDLKAKLKRERLAEFAESRIQTALYRPFTKMHLYSDKILNDRMFPSTIFPISGEKENRVLCVNVTRERPFMCLMVDCIPERVMTGGFGSPAQCFPFYIYDEDGTNRRENITDWALQNFRAHYEDDCIKKSDIFDYIYGLLHHPAYRERYAADLKRDLPHIPYAADFWAFADAGAQLAELHVNYEAQPQYPLEPRRKADSPRDLRVTRMRLSKDQTELIYNTYLTLAGVPAKALEYRLGTRSALEWLIDQYQVDSRRTIANNPNDASDPRAIVKLIGSVITVSLKTVEIVEGLPETFY